MCLKRKRKRKKNQDAKETQTQKRVTMINQKSERSKDVFNIFLVLKCWNVANEEGKLEVQMLFRTFARNKAHIQHTPNYIYILLDTILYILCLCI